MESKSSVQQSGRKQNCRAVRAGPGVTLAVHQSICSQPTPTHNNDGTAQSRYHTLLIMLLPLSPFKKQTFQVLLSLIYSIANTQIAYIYKLITATWIPGYNTAMNDFDTLLKRSYRNTHVGFQCNECLVFIWHFVCWDTTPPGHSCCGSNAELGKSHNLIFMQLLAREKFNYKKTIHLYEW